MSVNVLDPGIIAARPTSRLRVLVLDLLRRFIAYRTRRALNRLPDDLLRDMGLTRGEIAFVAEALAEGLIEGTFRAPAAVREVTAAGERRRMKRCGHPVARRA